MKNFLYVLMVGGLLASGLHSATAATKKEPKKKRVETRLRVKDQVTVVGSVVFTPKSGGRLKIDVIVANGAPAKTFKVEFSYAVVGKPAPSIPSLIGHLETDQEGTGKGHYQVDLSSIARLTIIPSVYLEDVRPSKVIPYLSDDVTVELE